MNFNQLLTSLQELDSTLKSRVAQSANLGLTLRNWLVGAYLVEFEQRGKERAKYGEQLTHKLAEKLDIKGLNARTLADCRLFHLSYRFILQTPSAKSDLPILQTLSAILENSDNPIKIPQNPPSDTQTENHRPPFAIPVPDLIQKLSFSHFIELLRIKDPSARAFYEIECLKATWSVRELKRQIGSLLYQRLGLSTDKEKLLRLTSEKSISDLQPADYIKDPYVFEFLGLKPKEVFRENDLETALLDHLQEFLLELGTGFCFEDRQKKIQIGQHSYFIDLVFYHRKLHCNILIELKVEPFSHANAGQLNTYVNYYKKHEMQDGDNPPIGLLLCTDKDHALVEYALGGMDKNLFVSAYQIALPSPEELETFLTQKF